MRYRTKVTSKYNLVVAIEDGKLPFPFNHQGQRPPFNLDRRSGAITHDEMSEIVPQEENSSVGFEDSLQAALKAWTENNDPKKLVALYQSSRAEFSKLSTPRTKYLYRGVVLTTEQGGELKREQRLDPVKRIEGWTTKKQVAMAFGNVIFKRQVPRQERLVALDTLGFELKHSSENEILCLGQPLMLDEIVEITNPALSKILSTNTRS